ncbi:DUF3017 domain-containing protein [uncultured Friedmanniella sp.]|uniref:DUF3017 domain-containing protein n=1 Tax=uncultured Friedmanniella sp. TaxID=335381 RepID=UPI0035CB5C4B
MSRPEPHAALSLRQWPLWVVVVGVVAGLVVVVLGDTTWRLGSLVIGASLLVGAVERIVLPSRGAGLLQVRSKPFDVSVLALVGIGVLVLAVAVPGGP